MKFAGKMIALVAVLLALSLAIGGYSVVSSALRADLLAATNSAQEDMKLFGLTLQALCLREQPNQLLSDQRADEQLRTVLRHSAVLQTYSYRITNAKGALVASTRGIHIEDEPPAEGIVETRLVQEKQAYYLCTRQRLSILDRSYLLERSIEITPVFDRARQNLRTYELVMLLILVVGTGITTGLTLVLTSPIRRISRTSKELAAGRYDKRAQVKSRDELGAMARDFNAMADALQSKIEALRESAQRQKDFTASFAHELKTPLTSVIGYADTLRSRALPPERQFEAANYIFTEGKRLEAMSFALLDLFALDKKEPERTLCRTEDLAKAAAQSAAYMLQQSGVQLETKVQPGTIQAAKELFVSLLFNLIDNARKASEPGQRITLSGEAVENGYCFQVRDRGRGIPPEALARITEPFYMVDKSRSRAQGGAGLGLTLCQRIAALHGAQLEIESREGQGTTVTIELKGDQA